MSVSGRQRSYFVRLLVTLYVLIPLLPQCQCEASSKTALPTTPSSTTSAIMTASTQISSPSASTSNMPASSSVMILITQPLQTMGATALPTKPSSTTSAIMTASTQISSSSASTRNMPASSSVIIPITQPPQTSDTKFAIKLMDRKWSDSLNDMNSGDFKELSTQVIKAVNTTLDKKHITAVSVVVERFREGSVIADINVKTTDPKQNVIKELKAEIASGNIGSLKVYPLMLLGKTFVIPITLKNVPANETAASGDLQKNISSLLNGTSQLIALHVNFTGFEVGVTAVFDQSVSLYAKNTLSRLLKQIETGRLGNQSVETSVNPYIMYPALSTKYFEIGYTIKQVCADIKIPEKHYASNRIAASLKDNAKFIKIQMVLGANCNADLLKANATVELTLSAADDPQTSFSPLYCETDTDGPTITATLLTPITPKPTKEIKLTCTPRPTTNTRSTIQPLTTKPVTQGPVGPLKTPKLFVRLKFEMTWREFCATQNSLKQKIAANLFDKDGKTVSMDRIKFVNRDKNCADPSKQNERPVDLWWYVSDKNKQNPDKCLTMKAMKVVKSLLDNGNTRQLGPPFSGKVISVELAGCAAPKGNKPLDNVTLILILAGAILGALLLLLACCCLCCGGRRRRRRRKYYEKSDRVEMFAVMNGDGTAGNDSRKKRRGKAEHSEGEGELKKKGKHGKGERNGNIDGNGAVAGHHGKRRSLDDDDDDDYADVYDDGCCGGGGGGGRGWARGRGADGGRRGGKGKGKGKGKDGKKMRKHENGKEDERGTRRGKDDEDGKINEGMENEDDTSKANKVIPRFSSLFVCNGGCA